MSIKIIKKEEQARGSFAGGAILENKPIGFPQDGGNQKPYSNLFYWANAWSDKGGLIGEHPHKMFEILSFVIAGEIQHYDSKYDRWLSLYKGDAQIIRSGSGITHAEKLLPGGRMFQVWFDPNIQKTMTHEASYDDYKSADMKYYEKNKVAIKNYIGDGGPIEMESEGVEINELSIGAGQYSFNIDKNKIHSYYLIKGELIINDKIIEEDDFLIVEDDNKFDVQATKETTLFVISSPKRPSYKTYIEL